jgi:hypothetical protein
VLAASTIRTDTPGFPERLRIPGPGYHRNPISHAMTMNRSKNSLVVQELYEIEKCIEANLSRYHRSRSGKKTDSFFLRALEELMGILAQGLRSVESRRSKPMPDPFDPTAQGHGSSCAPAGELEFLLDYEYEIQCLQVLGTLDRSLVPQGLRRGRGSRHDAAGTTTCVEVAP